MPVHFEMLKGTKASANKGKVYHDCDVNPRYHPDIKKYQALPDKRLCKTCTNFVGQRRVIACLRESPDGYIEEYNNKAKTNKPFRLISIDPCAEKLFDDNYTLRYDDSGKLLALLQKYVTVYSLKGKNNKTDFKKTANSNPKFVRQVITYNSTKSNRKCKNQTCWLFDTCKTHLRYKNNISLTQSKILDDQGIEGAGIFANYPRPYPYLKKLFLYMLYKVFLKRFGDIINMVELREETIGDKIYVVYELTTDEIDDFSLDDSMLEELQENVNFILRCAEVRHEKDEGNASIAVTESNRELFDIKKVEKNWLFVEGEVIAKYHGEKHTDVGKQQDFHETYDYHNTKERVEVTAPFGHEYKGDIIDAGCNSRNSAAYVNDITTTVDEEERNEYGYSTIYDSDGDGDLSVKCQKNIFDGEELTVDYGTDYWVHITPEYATWAQKYKYRKDLLPLKD